MVLPCGECRSRITLNKDLSFFEVQLNAMFMHIVYTNNGIVSVDVDDVEVDIVCYTSIGGFHSHAIVEFGMTSYSSQL